MTGNRTSGSEWLGLDQVAPDEWHLPVTNGVMSGASALFGGCATAAAVVVARSLAEQPVIFAASHFGALAKLGTEATIKARVIAAGRTLTHVEVEGTVGGNHSFLTRVTAGARPGQAAEGQWVRPPAVTSPDDSSSFDHPVHEGTWAERFEFRLATRFDGATPASVWWVRPRSETIDPLVAATILVDYVTYGVGRALGVPMDGLSVDNVVRVHQVVGADWYLLEVMPEAIEGGLGFGTARLFADGALVATGTQSIVVNGWDWRMAHERS
jgi:acyl-CoA thioesterase